VSAHEQQFPARSDIYTETESERETEKKERYIFCILSFESSFSPGMCGDEISENGNNRHEARENKTHQGVSYHTSAVRERLSGYASERVYNKVQQNAIPPESRRQSAGNIFHQKLLGKRRSGCRAGGKGRTRNRGCSASEWREEWLLAFLKSSRN
jgi:hypothetical protein